MALGFELINLADGLDQGAEETRIDDALFLATGLPSAEMRTPGGETVNEERRQGFIWF